MSAEFGNGREALGLGLLGYYDIIIIDNKVSRSKYIHIYYIYIYI
jgi:hypothetical protein